MGVKVDMGNFRIIVNAVGGHGDKRTLKDGEKNYGCMSMSCPDCISREFVATLTRRGCTIESATLEHWPATYTDNGLCTYSGDRLVWSDELHLQIRKSIGEHAPKCGLGDKGGPIVDDLVSGIRRGSFGNT